MNLLAAWLSALTAALLVGVVAGVWRPTSTRIHRGGTEKQEWLYQAGLSISPSHYRAMTLGMGILTFLILWALSGSWVIAALPGLGAMGIPRAFVARRRSQRLLDLQRAWPDGLRDLIASISSGMSLGRSLEELAAGGPIPLRRAFVRYPQLARSMGVVPALEVIKSEQAHPASDRVIEVLILANDRGGSIVVEILRDLATATTRDVWALEEIETLSLEQKINARVVFAVPWLVLVFMTLRPGPFRDFYGTVAGAIVVLIGGLASLFGMWLVGRLGAEPEEPRVFGEVST